MLGSKLELLTSICC